MTISPQELFEQYFDTVCRCTAAIRDESDDEIAYSLFEYFDAGSVFLHRDTVVELRDAGFIDDGAVALSVEIFSRWRRLSETKRSFAEIRADPEWYEMFVLGDQLRDLLSRSSREAML